MQRWFLTRLKSLRASECFACDDFCFEIIPALTQNTKIAVNTIYIVIEETDLVQLIKICKAKKLKPGEDIGIISYNDTPFKEILLNGISVFSTDHAKMGETAARLILENSMKKSGTLLL